MTRTQTANISAGAVLAVLILTAWSLGIQGTVDAAYDVGYSIGSFARML